MVNNTFLTTIKGSRILLDTAKKITQLILQKEDDMIQELLFYLTDVFPAADISLFDMEREMFLASTILEQEELAESSRFASSLRKSDGKVKRMTLVSPRLPAKLREHIVIAEQYPISFGAGRFFLLCEYSKMVTPLNINHITLFLDLLSLALSRYVLGIDESKDTRLRGREELIHDIEHPAFPLPCDKTLAIISLRDARMLNQELGYAQVDEYLAFIKITLAENYGSKLYRVGGTKFAILFFDPVYDVHSSVVEILDRFIDKDIPVSAVLTPLEDIYSALYICESYLKKVQINAVVVVREKDSKAELATSEELSNVYLKKTFDHLSDEDSVVTDNDNIEVLTLEDKTDKDTLDNMQDVITLDFLGGDEGG